MKRNKKFVIFTTLFVLFCFAAGCCGFLFIKIQSFIKTPLSENSTKKIFSIESGQTLKIIAHNLEKHNLISTGSYFVWYAKYKKASTKLKAGEYLLSASQSPEKILNVLLSGKVKLYKITLPEGLNIKEVAKQAEKNNICPADDFISLCYDKTFIRSLGIDADSLEGYLFPDTYLFPKKTDCKTLITAMTKRFHSIFTQEWKERADQIGLSVHEVVILASIIEKETGDASERPVISSVFHNRLKKRMRLESDPTVIYGIKNFDGNIKRKHLKQKTPYNTYRIKGLPIGPIANPGGLSMHAALYPDTTDYLFFVSKKDTTHYFSKNIKEHNRAVRKYQLRKR